MVSDATVIARHLFMLVVVPSSRLWSSQVLLLAPRYQHIGQENDVPLAPNLLRLIRASVSRSIRVMRALPDVRLASARRVLPDPIRRQQKAATATRPFAVQVVFAAYFLVG